MFSDNEKSINEEIANLEKAIDNIEDNLGGQPRWAFLSFFKLGYATIGYGIEYKKFELLYKELVGKINKYIENQGENYIPSEIINSFIKEEVFYYYKCNKINKVLKNLKLLRLEIK